jgi:protein-arginine kinase activator protein McsA
MLTKVRICDKCGKKDAINYSFQVDDKEVIDIDLCTDCVVAELYMFILALPTLDKYKYQDKIKNTRIENEGIHPRG